MNHQHSRTQLTRLRTFERVHGNILLESDDSDHMFGDILINNLNQPDSPVHIENAQNSSIIDDDSPSVIADISSVFLASSDDQSDDFNLLTGDPDADPHRSLILRLTDLSLTHRISASCLDGVLSIIEELGVKKFPRTARTLFRENRGKNYRFHYDVICSCQSSISWTKEEKNDQIVTCLNCGPKKTEEILRKFPYYINIDIIEQISFISEKFESVINSDGNDILLINVILAVDEIGLYKSSRKSLVPVILFIENLPRNVRFKFPIIATIYCNEVRKCF